MCMLNNYTSFVNFACVMSNATTCAVIHSSDIRIANSSPQVKFHSNRLLLLLLLTVTIIQIAVK